MKIRAILKRSTVIYFIWKKWKALCAWLKIFYFLFWHDVRFIKYSREVSRTKRIANIVMKYHVIEKGLTMPDRHLGFGQKAIVELIHEICSYIEKYGDNEPQILHAAAVIFEYEQLHLDTQTLLKEEVLQEIKKLHVKISVPLSKQIHMTREQYFSNIEAPFEIFSASRRSVRHFSGPVDQIQIEKAIQLANNAPSFCNRNPHRVRLISEYDLIQQCLILQKGNRGFGHLVKQLLILTTDLRQALPLERNCAHLNAGIYLMNLSYALHRNQVAHCMLNWSREISDDRQLRELIKMDDAEHVCVLIACGDVPEEFQIAFSPKHSTSSCLS